MTLYLDTSVIVPLFTIDSLSVRADELMARRRSVLILSDFAIAKFASVIARRYRTGELSSDEAKEAFTKFDDWTSQETLAVHISTADMRFATAAIRRLDLPLRSADAIHIAIGHRHNAEIATFDRQMARCAAGLGLTAISS